MSDRASAVQCKVLVLGSLNLDIVVRCARRPEPGETVLGDEVRRGAGGKGANQAAASAAAGARTSLLGRVGDDPEGRLLREQLEREDVGVEWVLDSDDAATGTALITVDGAGENSIVVVPGANARLSARDVDRADRAVKAADVLLMQFEIGEAPIRRAVELAARTTRVIVNASPVRPLAGAVLARADPVLVNRGEAAALLGAGGEASEEELALRLVEHGARSVVVTAGARGAFYADMGRRLAVPAPRVAVVDSTGGGDAFAGALAAAFARDDAVEHALEAAVAAGARAVGHPGARPAVGSRQDGAR